jgi:ribose-phosphate pyrophosphokinase
MNKIAIFNLYAEDHEIAQSLVEYLSAEPGKLKQHYFPDKEYQICLESEIKDKDVILVCSLVDPNPKVIPLIFFAKTAKLLGAKSVRLIAPYLSYMRQDKQFHLGEGISAHYFLELLGSCFDALITLDPHLHRIHALAPFFGNPCSVLHANQLLANWISMHVEAPYLIGPDEESRQWVEEIAKLCCAPFQVLAKKRKDDITIEIALPKLSYSESHTPILIDDIISSGCTMIEGVRLTKQLFTKPVVCMAIHALFAGEAYKKLYQAGAGKVVTTNSIAHCSNTIDISVILASAVILFWRDGIL